MAMHARDAEGRRVTSIDRAGRTTTFAYDALGRLTATIYPDGAQPTTKYDPIGQVIEINGGVLTP